MQLTTIIGIAALLTGMFLLLTGFVGKTKCQPRRIFVGLILFAFGIITLIYFTVIGAFVGLVNSTAKLLADQ